MPNLRTLLDRIPVGYSTGLYCGRKYGITRTEFNEGRSEKVFAKSLSDEDFISLNAYLTASGVILRPCEMPEEKVINFLSEVLVES